MCAQVKYVVTMVFSILLSCSAQAYQPISKAMTQSFQASLSPSSALDLLKAGNQRFVNGALRQYNFAKEMAVTTTQGQHPIAIILSCIDSRSIPDILFDQGLGNVFVSRIAGNVADKEILGSMEFATKVAGAPLIVVMGHTHCGAVRGACSVDGSTGMSNLDYLLAKIKPAVKVIKKTDHSLSCDKAGDVDKISQQNVLEQLDYIYKNSHVIKQLVKDDRVMLVGAMHDIATGQVTFIPYQKKSK